MKRFRRLSITQGIFAVTLAIAIAVAGTIILYTRHQGHEQALVVADELMNRSAGSLRQRAAALVAPIDMIVKVSSAWPEVEVAPSVGGHPSRARLLALMRDLPQVLHIFIGFEDGNYFQIKALSQLAAAQREPYDAPPGTVFIEDVILRAGTSHPLAVRRFLDRHGGTLATTTSEDPAYDPRTRPWYTAALETGEVVRTGVYTFAGDKIPGLTVSHRHNRGVVGIDITLTELGRFLDSTPEAAQGALAIFRESGEILAQSGVHGEAADAPRDQARHDLVVSSLIDQAMADRSFEAGSIEVEDELWAARVTTIGLGAGEPENLLVAMPVAEIVAPINRVSRDTLIVSVLILLASIPLIWLISRRVSRPLSRLVSEADEIRRFDLSDVLPTASVVEEIQSLQRAMARMRGSLRTFALYVPKALVKQLIERDQAPELGGKRRDVTVLFTDLENFTAMSSHLEPEQVMTRMSRYFETVTQTLLAHDATIDKYIGDAVMAFWNAPTDVPDHAGRACQAALQIIETAKRETDSWSQSGLPPLRTRIGIHCGEAIVGNVGSSDRMNYTALGDTVNLAARLEALNRELGTGILVSADVVARLDQRFVFRHVGKHAIKGFADGIDVFELTGVQARA